MSFVQPVGQDGLEPLHRNPPHDGCPADPAGVFVQVPGVALHWSHDPPHAVLQQYPSTQLPVVHSRQLPLTLQSLARLQVWP